MTQFWVTHGGQRRGPYEEAEILEAVELGTMRPTDLLWTDGVREGVPIAEVFEHLGAAAGPRSRPGKVVDDLAELALGNVTYAGFWMRFGAAVLDGVILGIVVLAIGLAFLVAGVGGGTGTIVLAIGIAISWLYFSFMESSPSGGTFGKRAFGLQVLSERMERVSFLRATGRWVGRFVSAAPLAIGYLMQPFTARKQALHDRIAGTLVVTRGRRTRGLFAVVVLCLVFAFLAGAGLKLAELLSP